MTKIEQKQDEIINWLEMRLNDLDSFDKYNELRSELAQLKAEADWCDLCGEKHNGKCSDHAKETLKTEKPLPLDLNQPWDTEAVINKLIWATEYLLHHQSYDGHGHEELQLCVTRGKEIIAKIQDQHKAEAEKEVSEPGFVRSGNSPDEIIWQGVEYVKKSSIIDYVCDACGCHPSVIINTAKGRFCQQHVQY